MKNYKHIPVLLEQAINTLNILHDGIYIDGTFGHGGHSRLILSRLGTTGRLLAIDRDPTAISIGKSIKDPRFSIVHDTFSALTRYANEYKIKGKVNGILFDLGVSSSQLENRERGFSFKNDGPLDMRMDPTHGKSAAEWLQIAKEDDIAWILKTFGEERFSKRIARAIVKYRYKRSITRTKELAEIIKMVIPVRNRKFKHPATRTFQAIRIFLNNELKEIEIALKESLDILSPDGVLSVISFHSLEDRIVKHFFREHGHGPQIPIKLSMKEEQIRKLKFYNRRLQILGKLVPNKEEIERNPRARSSILRFAKKISIQ